MLLSRDAWDPYSLEPSRASLQYPPPQRLLGPWTLISMGHVSGRGLAGSLASDPTATVDSNLRVSFTPSLLEERHGFSGGSLLPP